MYKKFKENKGTELLYSTNNINSFSQIYFPTSYAFINKRVIPFKIRGIRIHFGVYFYCDKLKF